MRKRWKMLLLLACIGIVTGGVVGVVMYNKPHRDIQHAKQDFTAGASELVRAFETDFENAESVYFGKVILVEGELKSKSKSEENRSVILAGRDDFFGVNCSFNPVENLKIEQLKEGQIIKVKGECKGYIDDVILVDCYLIE